jgi:holo-[acyl-carrier protein] synthase
MGEYIMGHGIDLVECQRIRQSVDAHGDAFLHRIFLPGELEYALSQKFSERPLAARFAAKEAVSKAFGTGIGADVGWKDIEIIRNESGAPHCQLHGKAADLFAQRQGKKILISLTHTDTLASASVILIAATAETS